CVNALIRQGMTSDKKVVVTGASGGVGSTAIALLHKLGFQSIITFSRKEESVTWLKSLGALQVVRPDEFLPETTKALGKQQIDYV
ncbi:NADPH:quinone reductase, partial [Enterococcus faecium]|nr:NADPH:quinone reductase [Enterococcus faecium]